MTGTDDLILATTQSYSESSEPLFAINNTATLEDATEESDDQDLFSGTSSEIRNSATELLHLIQQSTFFLKLAQQFLSQAANSTKAEIIMQTKTEARTFTSTSEAGDIITSSYSLTNGSTIESTTSKATEAFALRSGSDNPEDTTSSDDITSESYAIGSSSTITEENTGTATPSFSILVTN